MRLVQGVQNLLACELLEESQKITIQRHYASMLKKYPPLTTHWENLKINNTVSVKIATDGVFSIYFLPRAACIDEKSS